MAQTVTYVDSFQTRYMQSFVNLTKVNSTLYPAVTTMQLQYGDTSDGTNPVSAYFVFDQWALRTVAASGLA